MSGTAMSKKVVFFFPSFASSEATAPLGILAVATPLLRAGYQVVLIDSTITPNFKQRVLQEVRDAVCLGVSLVTGPMIRETVEIARAIKERQPEFPIILGGWHPSLLPTQTLEAPCVDYVVRGQGEEALLELVQHIESRSAPDLVAGIGFKRNGKLVFTAARPLRPITELPPKAYHLADLDAYERGCGRRWAMYISSLACPFNCAYCTNAGVYGRKWNALPSDQFVEETVDLTRRYNLELLWVVDDNFLVDLDRARDIAAGLVRAGAAFQWSIQATTNLVARLSLQDLESIYESAARCLAAGIRPSFNIIFAFPGEGRTERQETVRFIMDVCRRFPGAEFWTNIFTPYPGAPIMEKAEEIGIHAPTSFEGWADFFPRYTKLPWLDGREHQRLQVMREYLRIAFDRVPIAADRRGQVTRMIQKCISLPARWRLDRDVLAFPVELWLNNKLKQRTAALKPAVDAKRLEPAAPAAQVACP